MFNKYAKRIKCATAFSSFLFLLVQELLDKSLFLFVVIVPPNAILIQRCSFSYASFLQVFPFSKGWLHYTLFYSKLQANSKSFYEFLFFRLFELFGKLFGTPTFCFSKKASPFAHKSYLFLLPKILYKSMYMSSSLLTSKL